MRRTRIKTSGPRSSRMLQLLFRFQLHKSQSKQVRSLLAQLSIFPARHHFSSASLQSPGPSFSPYSSRTNEAHKDLSSINFSVISKSVISKCSKLLGNNNCTGETSNLSLRDYLLRLSNICPETIRRFWRVSVLNPHDVVQILLAFDSDTGKFENEVKKIESLWALFKWAGEQSEDFEHLPQSCKFMAKMLVRMGLFEEAESLLSGLDGKELSLDHYEIFSDLIGGYVKESNLERAISNYNQMRRVGLAPSYSCYLLLLDFLVQMNETKLAHRVYMDMVEMGFGRNLADNSKYENVVRLLCMDGKVQDARDLVKSVIAFGIKPSSLILHAIVSGYCEKKDYDDILSFFLEAGLAPDVAIGNKVVCSLTRNFGAERGSLFIQEFEQLGFCPDEITFGILIGQSISEGKLKNAFIYLSEMLSRSLKPHLYSYNALMSGLLKEGMCKQSCDILQEMKDSGVMPNLSTYRVLLAGFCKARQFGEVKEIVGDIADHGLIGLSLPEDPLSIALTLLGICPLSVRVRRDNDMQFSKTEFFDELGNGLYLETNLDEFDKKMDKVLDDAMIPDFNSILLKDNVNKDMKIAVGILDEMARWGQELSLSSFSTLMDCLSSFPSSRIRIKTMTSLLEKMPKSMYQLDQGTLNRLVQKYSKRGFPCRAKMIFYNMLRLQIEIENETYTALLMGLCKKGNLRSFHNCWKLARKGNWSPQPKNGKALLDCLCQQKLLHVALQLLETIMMNCSCSSLDAIHAFIEKLCCRGFTGVGHMLAEELWKHGIVLDDVAFCYFITGFCKERRIAEAFMIFDAMVAKNLDPPLDVSLLLIPQLCRAGNFEKAFALKETCLKNQPSALNSVYCALMSGLCEMGRVGEASKLLQEMLMKGRLRDTESYKILLQGFCQVADLKKVGELLGAMIRKNLGISISSYRYLMQMSCALGKFSVALSLKELMLRENSFPDLVIYNILIFYLSLAQNTLVLDTVINELEKKELQLEGVTYDFIVRGASRCKDVPRSLHYLKAMISEGFRPSNCGFTGVIACLCHHGELEKALQLSEEMESRGQVHGSVTQTYIFEALLKRGKLQEAVKFLDRMVVKGLIPESINYDYLCKRLCQHGEQEKAIDLLNIMLKKGHVPDSTSYDYLIQCFCMRHNLDLALDYHAEMLHRNLRPSSNTWTSLVLGCSEVGQVAEAESLLHLMVNIGETPSREMYSSVIHKYRSVNNLKKATKILQAMQQSGYEPDFETHWSLVSNLSHPTNEEDRKKNSRFLSRLLYGIGFAR